MTVGEIIVKSPHEESQFGDWARRGIHSFCLPPMYVCMYVCNVCMYVCMYVCIYIYIYMYIHNTYPRGNRARPPASLFLTAPPHHELTYPDLA